MGDPWCTWNSLDVPVPVEGDPGVSAIDAEVGPGDVRPGTGAFAVSQVDFPSKLAVVAPLMDADSTRRCIDPLDPMEVVHLMDIPATSSAKSTYLGTSVSARHCGYPQETLPTVPDLKRPLRPPWVHEKRLKTDALQASIIDKETRVHRQVSWWDADLKAMPPDGVESAISAGVAMDCRHSLGPEWYAQAEQLHAEPGEKT